MLAKALLHSMRFCRSALQVSLSQHARLPSTTGALLWCRVISLAAIGTMLLGLLLADLCIDVAYKCCSRARRRQHPCQPWLRPLASAEASLIKAFSEAGRAWGQLERGQPWNLLRSFDWFCGVDPGGEMPPAAAPLQIVLLSSCQPLETACCEGVLLAREH